jgi:hypothetical protein
MSVDINTSQIQAQPICRADGVTPAERYLKKLCDRSFLSFWSYPGIYRDQGKSGSKGDGKEVCDLLVVFENHIIIFSDKDCVFSDTSNIELDWSRWYRRAVQKSAEQVWGAERWILSHPDRLFLDRTCTIPFPIDLPDPKLAKVHRIVVAHDVSRRCIKELGGSGSLMIVPGIIGDMHYAPIKGGGKPFAIGQINPVKGYVHVFDDTTLDIVMTKLDTITDFVEYLTKKEKFITSGRLAAAAGEEDLLAFYLKDLNEDEEHDFIVPPDIKGVYIDEGLWEGFSNSSQRKSQILADEVSYAWDGLIEAFTHHIFAGTSYYTSHPGIGNQERYLRLLAREPRTRRRMLARAILDLIRRTPKGMKATRTILPSDPGEPHYVFLLVPETKGVPYEKYREVRRQVLESHLMITKLNFPDAQEIIGIATETGRKEAGSEDVAYMDVRSWTPEEQAEAERLQTEMRKLGVLGEYRGWETTEDEYPDAPPTVPPKWDLSNFVSKKGRNRNNPCPCGSGKKIKKCCGQ